MDDRFFVFGLSFPRKWESSARLVLAGFPIRSGMTIALQHDFIMAPDS